MTDTKDPRLINPTGMSVVKVDNLYQLKREKLHQYQVHDLELNTQVTAQRYFTAGYDFLQILTDGAICQNNVGRNEVLTTEEGCTCDIIFNDNEQYVIKSEIPTPVPLIKKQWFTFTNAWNSGQSENETVQGGYGRIKFLLTNFPYQWNLKKHNPHDCKYALLQADEELELWYGHNRHDSGLELRIPWIPKGFKDIIVWITTEATSYRVNIDFYPDCCDHSYAISSSSYGEEPVEYDGYGTCRRMKLTILNQEQEQMQFNVQVQWTRGSGNFGR